MGKQDGRTDERTDERTNERTDSLLELAGFYPPAKNNFQKLFLYHGEGHLKMKSIEFLISQKWLETLAPNFYQLSNFTQTHFVQNLKALGATDFYFPPKPSKTSNGCGSPIF